MPEFESNLSSGKARGIWDALLFLQWHSFRNRLVMRFKRLKQPKYLVGAIFGGLYFYFYFFRYFFMPMRRHSLTLASSPDQTLFYECLGALILFVIVLMAWIIPHERAALAFSEAEVSFLLPAPIRRRDLIHFKLGRSQIGILVTVFFLTLVTNRFSGHGPYRALGWWLILSLLNLHMIGSSFARTMLLDRGVGTWMRRVVVLSLAAVGAVAVALWVRQTIPGFQWQGGGTEELKRYGEQVFNSGPGLYLLFPFRVVMRPYFAQSAPDFAFAAAPVLLLIGLHYWWVTRSDVAFEEGSIEASRKLAERVTAMRAGQWRGGRAKLKKRRAPFRLGQTGPRVMGLIWKNLIGAGSIFTVRIWLILAMLGVGLSIALRLRWSPAGALGIGVFLGLMTLWVMLLGPQMVRQDFRKDLPMADLLKTYPLPAWQIAVGEVLPPTVILASMQYLMLLISFTLLVHGPGLGNWMHLPEQTAIFLSAALVLPLLDAITLQIPNAAVLLFPGWFQTGKDAPQGIEATGQRLLFMVGQIVVLAVALILPAALGFGIFLLAHLGVGIAFSILFASIAAAILLAVEAALGFLLLGKLFARLDITDR